MNRNKFSIAGFVAGVMWLMFAMLLHAEGERPAGGLPPRIKTSLNAFSFNGPLTNGSMDLDELLGFTAKTGFDAIDITAYYFPGYPEVPSDAVLYEFKRKAHALGLEISGTGVRNNFTDPDPQVVKESIQLVKDWIIAAEKLGAPVLRIFAGKSSAGQFDNEAIFDGMIAAIQECVEFGESHGVVVAIQNHWQFIKTADHINAIFDRVDSEWFGLILDTGSFRLGDPYAQIEAVVPLAVNWQLKEKVYVDGEEGKTDLTRVMKIIRASSYRGYVPIETLGEGDPKKKVVKFFTEVNEALALVNEPRSAGVPAGSK